MLLDGSEGRRGPSSGGLAARLRRTSDVFPSSVLVQFWSMELPATTVGEWRRR